MTETKTRTRRTFASEYELRAVQLVTEKGFSYQPPASSASATPRPQLEEAVRRRGG